MVSLPRPVPLINIDTNVYIGIDMKTGESVYITENDRFAHIFSDGPTRSGKTSKTIKPIIWRDLIEIKLRRINLDIYKLNNEIRAYNEITKLKRRNYLSREEKLSKITQIINRMNEANQNYSKKDFVASLSVIEPKGDLVQDVRVMCNTLEMSYWYVDPLDPKTNKMNVLYGQPDDVSETVRTILKNMFGEQGAFFSRVQETMSRNTVLMMKRAFKNDLDLLDITRALRDEKEMKRYLEEYKRIYGDDDLAAYFEKEMFGTNKDRYSQFGMGLRLQLDDIIINESLQRILLGKTDVKLDEMLEDGGILLVNTAMGKLKTLSDTFGQFVVMNLYDAVFARPGTEKTRPNHYNHTDEAPRYLSHDTERPLSIGASYRMSMHLAVQSDAQMRDQQSGDFVQTMLNNMRTKIVFGGVNATEAEMWEAEFGKEVKHVMQHTYEYRTLFPSTRRTPKSSRSTKQEESRFTSTQVMELQSSYKHAEAITKRILNGAQQKPVKIMTHVVEYETKPKIIIEAEKQLALAKSRRDEAERIMKGASTSEPNEATRSTIMRSSKSLGDVYNNITTAFSERLKSIKINTAASTKSQSNMKFVQPVPDETSTDAANKDMASEKTPDVTHIEQQTPKVFKFSNTTHNHKDSGIAEIVAQETPEEPVINESENETAEDCLDNQPEKTIPPTLSTPEDNQIHRDNKPVVEDTKSTPADNTTINEPKRVSEDKKVQQTEPVDHGWDLH